MVSTFNPKYCKVSVNSDWSFQFARVLQVGQQSHSLQPGTISWPDVSLFGQTLARRRGLWSRCNLCLVYEQLSWVIKKRKRRNEVTFPSPGGEVNTGCAHMHPMAGLEKQPMCVSITLQPYYKQAAFNYANASRSRRWPNKGWRDFCIQTSVTSESDHKQGDKKQPLLCTRLEDLQSIYM